MEKEYAGIANLLFVTSRTYGCFLGRKIQSQDSANTNISVELETRSLFEKQIALCLHKIKSQITKSLSIHLQNINYENRTPTL